MIHVLFKFYLVEIYMTRNLCAWTAPPQFSAEIPPLDWFNMVVTDFPQEIAPPLDRFNMVVTDFPQEIAI